MTAGPRKSIEAAAGGFADALFFASLGVRDSEADVWLRCRKFYFDSGHVEISAGLVHELDANGKQLRVVRLTNYTAEKVRTPGAARKAQVQRPNAKGSAFRVVSALSLLPLPTSLAVSAPTA